MMDQPSELTCPTLLVATPQVHDPFFDHSVVLLLNHDETGSFGFNINRPTELTIEDVLSGLDISWCGESDCQAFFGGPVQPQLGSVLFRSAPTGESLDTRLLDETPEVFSGLRMTQNIDHLKALAGNPPVGFRLYLGYAGWATGQLVQEILRNDWIIVPVIDELLFSSEPQSVWTLALEEAGVDPQSLPSWTPDQSASETN
jgi:putative transcriptional regulator